MAQDVSQDLAQDADTARTPGAQPTDVVVVGLGVAGEQVATRLAEEGLDVVGVEQRLLGGECPYWACVPTKMMVRAAGLLAEGRRIPRMAGRSDVVPEWTQVADRIRAEATDDWNDEAAVARFTATGARFVRGTARFTGPGTVEAGGETFVARRGVVIATGSRPAVPPVPGLDRVPYWTNREAVEAKQVPDSLLVLGGGTVGLEFAQVFARFGSQVTVVETRDRLLSGEEPEVSEVLADVLRREGVTVRLGARATGARLEDGGIALDLDGEGLLGQRLLVATGRRANLAELGLEHLGLDPAAGRLAVDGRLRAGPGVWAVGDVTGHGLFTHVAVYQASLAADAILGRPRPEADYRALPRVTFTDPEVAAVGLTERQARERGLRVRTGFAELPTTARGWLHQEGNRGFVKLVADAARDVLVGATVVGPAGGEVLAGPAVAVQAEVPLDRLRQMIYAYPTFHRGVEDALRDLDRSG